MPNYYGRMGAPMVQPTKDSFRRWLREAREELRIERSARERAELRLADAKRVLGQLVMDGKIEIPIQRLGELALEISIERERTIDQTLIPA